MCPYNLDVKRDKDKLTNDNAAVKYTATTTTQSQYPLKKDTRNGVIKSKIKNVFAVRQALRIRRTVAKFNGSKTTTTTQ